MLNYPLSEFTVIFEGCVLPRVFLYHFWLSWAKMKVLGTPCFQVHCKPAGFAFRLLSARVGVNTSPSG